MSSHKFQRVVRTHYDNTIKNQSAMEYLMTYGWSILIVAVVLGALSFLGVFNPLTFAPKATAGNCQVVKNAQLGVSNLVGSCNNQVPQYVAQFNGKGQITVQDSSSLHEFYNMTYVMWMNIQQQNTEWLFGKINCPVQNGWYVYTDSAHGWHPTFVIYNGGTRYEWDSGYTMNANEYYQLIIVFKDGIASLYMNGENVNWTSQPTSADSIGSPVVLPPLWFGAYLCGGYNFIGELSNVQIYNSSLPGESIQSLYREGIGGVPVDPQNLVGWWTLNGNANDYSGNNNNGVPTNVVFTSSWFGGYTQP